MSFWHNDFIRKLVSTFVLLLIVLSIASMLGEVRVKAETASFENWMEIGKFATLGCTTDCSFAYLNSSGLTEYQMQTGFAFVTWRIMDLNSTVASVKVNISASGQATRICQGCSQDTVQFHLNEVLGIKVQLATGSVYLHGQYIGKNMFWLPTKYQPGDVVDAGIAMSDNGSSIPLSARVDYGRTAMWPRAITLNVTHWEPYISYIDYYDRDLGYALSLMMPGVPALPDDALKGGHFGVGNRTVTSIAGIPLAVELNVAYFPTDVFVLTQTNIKASTGSYFPELLEVALTIASITGVVAVVLVILKKRHGLPDTAVNGNRQKIVPLGDVENWVTQGVGFRHFSARLESRGQAPGSSERR